MDSSSGRFHYDSVQGTTLVTITYTAGFTVGDSLRVTANNACGSSQARALKINRNSNASTPSAITGTIYGVCNQSNVAYSVTNVAGVTYAWSWNVANASIVSGQGTNAITVSFASTFVTGKLSVTATNACGTSNARTISVYARPAVPGAITGATSVCSMEQGVAYSIAPVANASSYIWYAPSGSTITDGVTTSTSSSFATTATSVFVNFGSTAGQVRVKGVNSCAQGGVVATTVSFAVCKNAPFASSEMNNPSAVVFPNPSKGNFSIRIANEKTTTAITDVTVLNEFGQQVYKGRVNIVNGNISLNLEDKLINGIYMVQYTVSGKTIVKKVMISK
ncbi:MAG: T9SS type A sorting domain-containing protein [Ferruginibacter sp.]